MPPTPTSIPATETPEPSPTIDPNATPEPHNLNYYSFFGSAASGEWDEVNLNAYLEMNPHVTAVFEQEPLYNTPVPLTIDDIITGDTPPDVMSGCIVGNLRHTMCQ